LERVSHISRAHEGCRRKESVSNLRPDGGMG
jgi:hypothetical protein